MCNSINQYDIPEEANAEGVLKVYLFVLSQNDTTN